MSYCTDAEFKERYDLRTLEQLTSDNNTGIEVAARLQAALDDATSLINAAALVGGIYTEDQLLALVASGDKFLVMLCAQLAFCGMARRRGAGLSDNIREDCKEAKETLAQIRDGSLVLNIDGAITLPELVESTENEIDNLELPSSDPFFGGPKATKTIRGRSPNA